MDACGGDDLRIPYHFAQQYLNVLAANPVQLMHFYGTRAVRRMTFDTDAAQVTWVGAEIGARSIAESPFGITSGADSVVTECCLAQRIGNPALGAEGAEAWVARKVFFLFFFFCFFFCPFWARSPLPSLCFQSCLFDWLVGWLVWLFNTSSATV
jgi:hypothetical protein